MFVKEHHITGLSWNMDGGNAIDISKGDLSSPMKAPTPGGPPPPPPPPPPPVAPAPPPAPAAGSDAGKTNRHTGWVSWTR